VINAFQNVADALRGLQADAHAMKAALHAEETAKASLDIVEKQLNEGQSISWRCSMRSRRI
jgi:outer membrane protein TolC